MKTNIKLEPNVCPLCGSEIEVYKSDMVLFYFTVFCKNKNCELYNGLDYEDINLCDLRTQWTEYYQQKSRDFDWSATLYDDRIH